MGPGKSRAQFPRGRCRRNGGGSFSTGSNRPAAPWARGAWINICGPTTRRTWTRAASPKEQASGTVPLPVAQHVAGDVEIKLNPVAAAGTEGFSQVPDVCVGGQTHRRRRCDQRTVIPHPGVDAGVADHRAGPLHAHPCWHARRVPAHVVDCIKDGKGYPKLLNDEMVIPFYLANGATMKEALDWSISGCCENRLPNRETNVTAGGRHKLRIRHRNDVPTRETEGPAAISSSG